MQQPLQITFRGMERSPSVEDRIRKKAACLEHYFEHIVSCHVIVDAPHRRHNKGNLYSVRVDIGLADRDVIVGREHERSHAHENVYVALRDAFNAAKRQLEDYVRQRRGRVKTHEVPTMGWVTKLFSYEGYGFVETHEGLLVYFHKNSVGPPGFDKLERGEEVRVVIAPESGDEGPQASTIIPLGRRHDSVHPEV